MVNPSDFKGLDKSLRIQKIIDTATELFHRKGYRSTTLEDVSKELGVTKAALYHYVSSKEKLLYIIYIQALENIFKNTYRISGMDLPADEKLKLIIRNHVKDIIIQSVSMFSVFFTEENQLSKKDFKKIQEEKKKYNLIVEKIIEEGISQGLLRKTDVKLQAYGIIGMCNWVYKWYRPGDSFFGPDEIADHFIALLETGYLQYENPEYEAVPRQEKRLYKKSRVDSKEETYKKLKAHCLSLIEAIDELES